MPKSKLRYSESHYPAAGLPFYAESGNYWCLPPVGGYHGGEEAGQAMAQAYLKHMAEIAETDPTALLHYVVLSMRQRMAEAEGNAQALDSIHGQSIGFFKEVCNFIRDAMIANPQLAKPYKQLDPAKIVKQANKALRS